MPGPEASIQVGSQGVMDAKGCSRCGCARIPSVLSICPECLFGGDDLPLTTVGGFELIETLGQGGMGTVYRAHHRGLGCDVAVKVLSAELADHGELHQRLSREAKILAKLDHPNIVRVYDAGWGDEHYVVMELVRGQPLSRQLPMAAAPAIDIAIQICNALAHAHAYGIVHRDIKPENILIDDNAQVKVADFGIARIIAAEDAESLTATQTGIGTPQYMAPEALRGDEPDPQMDIYSVGVVLYQALTGELPIGVFEPLSGAIDAVVRKALAGQPQHRYATVDELRTDLQAVLDGAMVAERRPLIRRPALWRLASACALVLCCVAMIASWHATGQPSGSGSASLVGEWAFDDGSVTDGSVHSNDGSVVGATPAPDRHGVSDRAFRFDRDQYIRIPHNDALAPAASITFSAGQLAN